MIKVGHLEQASTGKCIIAFEIERIHHNDIYHIMTILNNLTMFNEFMTVIFLAERYRWKNIVVTNCCEKYLYSL